MATAAVLADSDPEVINQEDVFFSCDGARLKLRIFDSDHGELIRYERDDIAEVRCSRYSIARTSDPRILLEILTRTLGVVGTVKKARTLFLAGQTRIHIDHVEGLGDFLELEVVLKEDQDEEDGKHIATKMLREFGIHPLDLIAEAYIDLLGARKTA